MRRRKEGQQLQDFKKRQEEEDLKQLKEERKKERVADQEARRRILEQIEQDRRERANKFVPTPSSTSENTTNSQQNLVPQNVDRSEFTRIQFKKPDGETVVNTFNSSDKFLEVKNYVHNNLLLGTGIRDFVLATTFPRKEFTPTDHTESLTDLGLVPSAVLLIIPTLKSFDASTSVSSASRGFFAFIYALFQNLMIPFNTIFNYIGNYFAPRKNATSTGAQKRSNEERSTDDHDE